MLKKCYAFTLILSISVVIGGCSSNSNESQAQEILTTNESTNTQSTNTPTETPSSSVSDVDSGNDNGIPSESSSNNILVAYFSREGNTREYTDSDAVSGASLPTGRTTPVAEYISEETGGDLFEIITTNRYSPVYNEVTEFAQEELEDDVRPELATRVENMNDYDVIFVGYPNWWGTLPMAVFSFIEAYDFSGKTIIPFSTHQGSSLGRSVRDIERLSPESTVMDGLAIRSGNAENSQDEVSEWLQELGIIE